MSSPKGHDAAIITPCLLSDKHAATVSVLGVAQKPNVGLQNMGQTDVPSSGSRRRRTETIHDEYLRLPRSQLCLTGSTRVAKPHGGTAEQDICYSSAGYPLDEQHTVISHSAIQTEQIRRMIRAGTKRKVSSLG